MVWPEGEYVDGDGTLYQVRKVGQFHYLLSAHGTAGWYWATTILVSGMDEEARFFDAWPVGAVFINLEDDGIGL